MPIQVDHQKRRAEIARIVAELASEVGIEQVTFREVAKRAGFSTMTVAHYFRDKKDLLVFTSSEARLHAARRVRDAIDSGKDLLTCLSTILPITKSRQIEWHTWFGFWGMALSEPQIGSERRDSMEAASVLFIDAIKAAQNRGELPKRINREFHATRLQIVINGIASLAISSESTWPPERQVDLLRREIKSIKAGTR